MSDLPLAEMKITIIEVNKGNEDSTLFNKHVQIINTMYICTLGTESIMSKERN